MLEIQKWRRDEKFERSRRSFAKSKFKVFEGLLSPPLPLHQEKEENSPSLVAAGIKFEPKKKKAERGIPPRWKPRGIKGGKKVVR